MLLGSIYHKTKIPLFKWPLTSFVALQLISKTEHYFLIFGMALTNTNSSKGFHQ